MIIEGLPALTQLAEQRIAEAIARGELSNLPGEGAPLELDDDRLIPVEQRLACRILKNSGLLPPELEEIAEAFGDEEGLGRDAAVAERVAHGVAEVQRALSSVAALAGQAHGQLAGQLRVVAHRAGD